jgi:hypothetical protein
MTRESTILLAIFPIIAIGILNGLYLPVLALSNRVAYWFADAAAWVVLPAACTVFLVIALRLRPADFGFRSLSFTDLIGLCTLVTFAYWVAYEPVKDVAHRFFWQTAESNSFVHALPESQPWRWLLVFYASLTAALVEEPVFRSLPWLYFSSSLANPEFPFVASTAILFAAVHWEQGIPGLIAAGSLGVVAAMLYTKIRNVWPFVVAHFIAGVWSHPWT